MSPTSGKQSSTVPPSTSLSTPVTTPLSYVGSVSPSVPRDHPSVLRGLSTSLSAPAITPLSYMGSVSPSVPREHPLSYVGSVLASCCRVAVAASRWSPLVAGSTGGAGAPTSCAASRFL